GSLIEHGLDLQADFDLIAHEETAAFQGTVPMEAEVLSVQGGLRADAGPPVAERIDVIAPGMRIERHRPVDPAHGKHASDRIAVLGRLAYRGTLKDNLGITFDIEKVDATKVIVPDRDAGINRRRVEPGNDHGLCRI